MLSAKLESVAEGHGVKHDGGKLPWHLLPT